MKQWLSGAIYAGLFEGRCGSALIAEEGRVPIRLLENEQIISCEYVPYFAC